MAAQRRCRGPYTAFSSALRPTSLPSASWGYDHDHVDGHQRLLGPRLFAIWIATSVEGLGNMIEPPLNDPNMLYSKDQTCYCLASSYRVSPAGQSLTSSDPCRRLPLPKEVYLRQELNRGPGIGPVLRDYLDDYQRAGCLASRDHICSSSRIAPNNGHICRNDCNYRPCARQEACSISCCPPLQSGSRMIKQ